MPDRGLLRRAGAGTRTAVATIATAVWTLTSCNPGTGSTGSVPPVAPSPDPCVVALESAAPRKDTLTVALTEPLRLSDARTPRNDVETLVLRQLYETLVRVDCTGRIRPALAERWERSADGLEWTFSLRAGLRFADGSPLDATAVRSSWQRVGEGGTWPWPAIVEVDVVHPNRLRVRLAQPRPGPPIQLADPALAVTGPRGSLGWPAESGAYRLALADSGAGGLVSLALFPATSGAAGPVLRVIARPDADPRDLIDQDSLGIDVVITRDPAALAYAQGRDWHTTPLPWDRTYVLITPHSSGPVPRPTPESRDALARDAVPGEARGAEAPFWWEGDSLCSVRGPVLSNPAGVIAFPTGDPVARALAERVLALATSASPPHWLGQGLPGSGLKPMLRVMAYDAPAFDSLLARGGASLFVARYPRAAPAGCRGVPRRAIGFAPVPLVDVRAYVIVRRGIPPFAIDGDGMVRFLPYSSP